MSNLNKSFNISKYDVCVSKIILVSEKNLTFMLEIIIIYLYHVA